MDKWWKQRDVAEFNSRRLDGNQHSLKNYCGNVRVGSQISWNQAGQATVK